MTWTFSRAGVSDVVLNSSFNLQSYDRVTEFTLNTLQGSGQVIQSESIHNPARPLTLTGNIKGTDVNASDTELMTIETMLDSEASDITLTNSVTSTSYEVQHRRTSANRLGGGILQVRIELLTNYTRH